VVGYCTGNSDAIAPLKVGVWCILIAQGEERVPMENERGGSKEK